MLMFMLMLRRPGATRRHLCHTRTCHAMLMFMFMKLLRTCIIVKNMPCHAHVKKAWCHKKALVP